MQYDMGLWTKYAGMRFILKEEDMFDKLCSYAIV